KPTASWIATLAAPPFTCALSLMMTTFKGRVPYRGAHSAELDSFGYEPVAEGWTSIVPWR
ncbi:MAG: hypothetical protein QOE55_2902, partial [Acidobacteriaceae bacterium]|nr:hypothetical protein [Acidobacteriaceae bacterium]